MPEVVGVVERVNEKVLPSGKYYSFLIDDVWYRTGRDQPSFEAGYKVKFTFEEDKYGKQVKVDQVKFKEGEAPPARGRATGGKPKTNSEFWENKEARDIDTQMRISFNGAFNSATALVTAAFANDIISLPAKTKAADKLDAFRAMVEEETVYLYRKFQNVPKDSAGYMATEEEAEETFDVEEAPTVDDVEEEEEW